MGEGAAVKDAEGSLAPAMVAVLALLFVGVAGGCGTIGPPVPPEEIGIAARLEQEKQKEAEREKARKAAEEPEALPEPEEDVPDDVMQPLVLPR